MSDPVEKAIDEEGKSRGVLRQVSKILFIKFDKQFPGASEE